MIKLNKYGLFDTMNYAEEYIKLRRIAIEAGVNAEDFWKELPVRLSKIKYNG